MPDENIHRIEHLERQTELHDIRLRTLEVAVNSHVAASEETNNYIKNGIDQLKVEVGELKNKSSQYEGNQEGTWRILKIIVGVFTVLSALANVYFILQMLSDK